MILLSFAAGRRPLRFILIDKLLELEPGRRAVASVTFPGAHDVFTDHFPGNPLVPGALLTEAMAQTAGWLIAATIGFDRWPLLVMIEHAKFRRLVGPNEPLDVTAIMRSARGDRFIVDGDAGHADNRVASARLVFHTTTFALAGPDRDRFTQWARQTFADLGGPSLLGGPNAGEGACAPA